MSRLNRTNFKMIFYSFARLRTRLRMRRMLPAMYLFLALFSISGLAVSQKLAVSPSASQPQTASLYFVEPFEPQLVRYQYPDRVRNEVNLFIRALKERPQVTLQDFPLIVPDQTNQSVTFSGTKLSVWIIEGNGAYHSFASARHQALHDPEMLLLDAQGNIVKSNASCNAYSPYPCLKHVLLEDQQTYVLLVYDQSLETIAAKLSYRMEAFAPLAPDRFQLVARTSDALRFNWADPNPDGTTAHYLVQRKNGQKWENELLTDGTDAVFTRLGEKTERTYRVIAVDQQGTNSAPSKELTAITYGKLSLKQSVRLPVGVSDWELPSTGDAFLLSFRDFEPAIRRPVLTVYGPDGELLATNRNPVTNAVAAELEVPAVPPSEFLTLHVETVMDARASEMLYMSRVDYDQPTTPLLTFSNLLYRDRFVSCVDWTVSTDNDSVKGYEVERNSVVTDFTDYPRHCDYKANEGETYRYRVRAIDQSGNVSPWSNPVSVSIPAQPEYLFYVPDTFVGEYAITVDHDRQTYPKFYTLNANRLSAIPGYAIVGFDRSDHENILALSVTPQTGIRYYDQKTVFPAGGMVPGTYWLDGDQWVKGKPDGRSAVIYYPSIWHSDPRDVYIHYRLTGSSWTMYPGVKMSRSNGKAQKMIRIPLSPGQKIEEAAFYTETGAWDNRGGKNFSFDAGIWSVKGSDVFSGKIDYAGNLWISKSYYIRYCGVGVNDKIYFHFKADVGNWTNYPGFEMHADGDPTCRGFSSGLNGNATVIEQAAFYNSSTRSWDNNHNRNYTIPVGNYLIKNQTVTPFK